MMGRGGQYDRWKLEWSLPKDATEIKRGTPVLYVLSGVSILKENKVKINVKQMPWLIVLKQKRIHVYK